MIDDRVKFKFIPRKDSTWMVVYYVSNPSEMIYRTFPPNNEFTVHDLIEECVELERDLCNHIQPTKSELK